MSRDAGEGEGFLTEPRWLEGRSGEGGGTEWGRSGDGVGTEWGRSGDGVGTASGRSRDGVGTEWGRSGDGVGTEWGRSGDGVEGRNALCNIRNGLPRIPGCRDRGTDSMNSFDPSIEVSTF